MNQQKPQGADKVDISLRQTLYGVAIASIAVGLTIIGSAISVNSELATHREQLNQQGKQLEALNDGLLQIVTADISSIKARLLVIESKEILPGTAKELAKIHDLLSALEVRVRNSEFDIKEKRTVSN